MSDENIEKVFLDLFAIVRDKQLGYPDSELHIAPENALDGAYRVLVEETDLDADEVFLPQDQRRIGVGRHG